MNLSGGMAVVPSIAIKNHEKLKTLLLAIAVCALAAGCSHSSAPVYEPFSLDGAEPLKGTVLCDSIVASVVVDMMPVGDYLAWLMRLPTIGAPCSIDRGNGLPNFARSGKGRVRLFS